MRERYDAEEKAAMEWFRPMKRGLLAPYAVGTVDQALMSALNVRFGFLRLFGLSGKVLIIDEVHAYDAYMNSILTMLLRWCSSLGIPVILLSATLPQSKRMKLVSAYTGNNILDNSDAMKKTPYPLITLADGPGSMREIPIEGPISHIQISLYRHYGKLGDPAAAAKLAVSLSENGGCICIIANTVTSAQSIYSELKKLPIKDTIIKLFHARFRAERRQEIENEVLDMFDKRSLLPENDPARTVRPRRAILVATQVVEQSLDLDFDEMITEIAPIDLILQRSGRLHRHQREKRPSGELRRLHILYPDSCSLDFGPTKLVYDSYTLIRTLFAINIDNICLPDDMRELVEIVYSEKELPFIDELQWIRKEDIKIAYDKMKAKESKDSGESATYLIRQPDIEEYSLRSMAKPCIFKENEGDANSYFYASTRISDYEEKQVILLEGDEYASKLDLERSPGRAVMASIMKNLVNLPAYWIDNVRPCEGYDEIYTSPRWLPGKLILRLKHGQWNGIDERRKRIAIRNDEELGIIMEKEGKSGNI
jgi:CRISPR-associated endonuclease/helicase Cas3